jgi:rSAM/selenodomain-associated transferase 1
MTRGAARRRRVYIFVKTPAPGRVKTRLGREIGMVAAAWWFRHQVARLVRRLRDPRWELWLAVAPDAEGMTSRALPALPRRPQGAGNLGQRMARVLRQPPPGPALIVGADVPGLGRMQVAAAFAALGWADAAFGPAEDGGYYLVGLARGRRAAPYGMFAGVRWSGPHTLADTLWTLRDLKVAFIGTLPDVDEAADLTTGRSRTARAPDAGSARS